MIFSPRFCLFSATNRDSIWLKFYHIIDEAILKYLAWSKFEKSRFRGVSEVFLMWKNPPKQHKKSESMGSNWTCETMINLTYSLYRGKTTDKIIERVT